MLYVGVGDSGDNGGRISDECETVCRYSLKEKNQIGNTRRTHANDEWWGESLISLFYHCDEFHSVRQPFQTASDEKPERRDDEMVAG
jgi:hypothetical protein